MDFSIRTLILLIILLIAISFFAVLIWYPLGYIMNEGFLEGMFGGYGRIMADYLLIAYIAIICIGTWILLLLYILYILIKPIFIVNIPLFGPIIAEILHSITPFRELRETGVVDFFNNIFGIAGASKTAGEKTKGIFGNTIDFLLTAGPVAGREVMGNSKPKTPNAPSASTSNETTSSSSSDELKDIKSCPRKQYIIRKHQDCLDKNVKDLPSTIGGFERIKIQSQNTTGKLKCDMEKIRHIQCIIQQEQDEENGKPIQSVSECLKKNTK